MRVITFIPLDSIADNPTLQNIQQSYEDRGEQLHMFSLRTLLKLQSGISTFSHPIVDDIVKRNVFHVLDKYKNEDVDVFLVQPYNTRMVQFLVRLQAVYNVVLLVNKYSDTSSIPFFMYLTTQENVAP
jgi:hypothetical protein